MVVLIQHTWIKGKNLQFDLIFIFFFNSYLRWSTKKMQNGLKVSPMCSFQTLQPVSIYQWNMQKSHSQSIFTWIVIHDSRGVITGWDLLTPWIVAHSD